LTAQGLNIPWNLSVIKGRSVSYRYTAV